MILGVDAQLLCDPNVRGTGIGRMLLELLPELAAQLDEHQLVLFSNYAGLDHLLNGRGRRVPSTWPTASLPGRLVWEQTVLPSLLKREHTQVLFSPSYTSPLAARCPTVVMVPEVAPMFTPRHLRPALRARVRRRLCAAAIQKARAVLTISQYSARRICEAFSAAPCRVHVIRLGSPPQDFVARAAWRLPERVAPPAYLLGGGMIQPRKNLPLLIEAYARIADLVRHDLVLAGPPSWGTAAVRAALERTAVSHRVHFLGAVSDAWLPALYRRATAFVFPSLEEGFGLPVLEAFACGTAVVAARAGAIQEVCGDAALLFDPRDAGQLAGLLLDVIRDPVLRTEYVLRGERRAAAFSWARAARTLRDVLVEAAEVVEAGHASQQRV